MDNSQSHKEDSFQEGLSQHEHVVEQLDGKLDEQPGFLQAPPMAPESAQIYIPPSEDFAPDKSEKTQLLLQNRRPEFPEVRGDEIVDYRLESVSKMEINQNFSKFMKSTQSHFQTLRDYLKKTFVQSLNYLEDNLSLDKDYLSKLLDTKDSLLEVQQRFFELRQVHKEAFLQDLEAMILQLIQRVMNLETQVKQALAAMRGELENSNKKIGTPNFENLLNAKKFHLRKVIRRVEYEKGHESFAGDKEEKSSQPAHRLPRSLIVHFREDELYRLQMEQKLRITPESMRNCLFFVIQSPQKIQINFKKNLCKLSFFDADDCIAAHDTFKKQIIKREKSACERWTKKLGVMLRAMTCCLSSASQEKEFQAKLKKKQMQVNLMENSHFLLATQRTDPANAVAFSAGEEAD